MMYKLLVAIKQNLLNRHRGGLFINNVLLGGISMPRFATKKEATLAYLANQEIALKAKLEKASENGDEDDVKKYQHALRTTEVGTARVIPSSLF